MTGTVLLTREQLAAWRTFDGEAWAPFREAWLGRGFRWPPTGDPDDDPETSVRSRLWPIADARPGDLGRWVRESRGTTPYAVLGDVFARWRGLRDELGLAQDEAEAAAAWHRRLDRDDAAESLRSILGRLP